MRSGLATLARLGRVFGLHLILATQRTGIPYHEMEALVRVLLPEIQSFFESGEGQRQFTEWKAQQEKGKVKHD